MRWIQKALINKLQETFEANNQGDKKYSRVWLSQLNYGGLYYSKDFALKLKAEHKIERLLTEISFVSSLIREKAAEESKSIMRISVYGPDEKAEPESDDYIIYEDATALT